MIKKLFHFITSRLGSLLLLILFEVFWIWVLAMWLHPYAELAEAAVRILGGIVVVYILNHSKHLSYDNFWIILILLVPVGGTLVYFFLDVLDHFSSSTYKNIVIESNRAASYYEQNPAVLTEMLEKAPELSGQCTYITEAAGWPVYRNRQFDYYPCGEDAWPVMLEELKKARRFIFIEYFIIEEGAFWNSILDILTEKVQEGVECRVIYDDLGSINAVPINYADKLEKLGIHAQAFNKVNPIVNGVMQHRDHRKILVIDGHTAFTGGLNLADEYVNKKMRFGYWKDNCVRVKGDAVWSMTVMFLTIWNAAWHQDPDYRVFMADAEDDAITDHTSKTDPALLNTSKTDDLPADTHDGLTNGKSSAPADTIYSEDHDGWIAPYSDTPLDSRLTGEDIYLNIINQAKRYCYIFTPYLIIDNSILNAMILAAQRGVDVRIITPGIPDKRIVYNIGRTYYGALIRGGVRIFSYTPGFDHSKTFVSDDRVAVVGTQNLDYRSLYLHFEDGVCLFDSKKIPEIRTDFESALAESHEITLEELSGHLLKQIFFGVLRLFAPFL